jgi:membrane peptidoglycan carboxypeptidase
MVPIIKKIVDREGETIWEYVHEPVNVLSNRVSSSVKEILRMAVENGTGKNAKDAIILSVDFENGRLDIPVPAFGKTGTSNRNTNSSFAGFIPGLNETSGQFDTSEGYVIVSYIGYDDNRPMKGPHMSIYGSSGALPLWVDTSNAIVNSREYKSGIHIADLAFFSKPELHPDDNLRPVSVSSLSGLPQSETEGEKSPDALYIYSDMKFEGDELRSGRDFEPIQGADNE